VLNVRASIESKSQRSYSRNFGSNNSDRRGQHCAGRRGSPNERTPSDTRVELSAAIVDAEARKLIEQFVNDGVNRASQTLKEASYKFEIGTIAVNSIRLQNVIFANSTDGSGRVNIQTTAIKRAQSSLCPLWPFC
jgi:hypothetical protein